MPDHGEQVDAQRLDVDADLADGLGGVAVQQRPVLAGEGARSAIGCRAPVSLLAAITDTSTVSSSMAAASAAGSTSPSPPTGSTVTWAP
ncbi:hypothetical protein AB0C28_50660 [Nonomuraea sp. NPDC048892]|uniref:hypothetical protein n=1 Tax=Nonomuraea sp. NPDC048892 TaxID=3154624 RepID=UPI0033CC07A9